MRYAVALSSILAAALVSSFAAAQPADPSAVAAACGGEVTHEEAKRMAPAKLREKVACFTRVAAEQFSRTLPQKVDDITVLQRVSTEGTTLTYHYSVNILKSELPANALDAAYVGVRKKVCEAPDMRAMIGYGAAYRYRWYDRNATLMGELLVASC